MDRFAGPGSLRLDAHDFCEPAPHGEFDAILNISAWEELAPDERHAAARVFFAALRPDGYVIFSTEDHVTDELEQPLLAAGFVIHYHAAARQAARCAAPAKVAMFRFKTR